MRNNHAFDQKRVLVIGLAKSGVSVAKLLLSVGALVTVNDKTPIEENPDAQELVEAGIRVITGGHPVELLEEQFDFVVKNPGIPYSNVMVARAVELGIPVYTEIEIASQLMEGTVVGITGSNGKTTTTTLASLMLQASYPNRNVYAAGNIGIPLSSLAESSQATDIFVTELSSFQLMGIETLRPRVACIVNIFSAHLDYHGTREAYIEAKLRITMNQTKDDYLVYNADYPELLTLIDGRTKAQLIPFTRKGRTDVGVSADEEAIYFNGERVMSLSSIHVPGTQNVENVAAAVAIAKLLGADNEDIEQAVSGFHGVKHRTQFVKKIQDRRFYNDSKATNIIATQTALKSFDGQSVVLIAGGLDRGNGFEELVPNLRGVSAMILYGETKDKLLEAAKEAEVPVIEQVSSLGEAVPAAYRVSKPGDVVLLSPACASWDQFKSFEERGDVFIDCVEKLG